MLRLLEKFEDRGTLAESEIDQRIRAGLVRSDGDQILVMAVGCENSLHPIGGGEVLWLGNVWHDSADAGEHVDRWPMSLLGESSRQNDVAVQKSTDSIGDRLIEVIAIDKDCVHASDTALLATAAALNQLGECAEDARRKSACSRWLTCGKSDFALSVSKPSQRIDQQQNVAALITKELGDSGSEMSRSQS